MGFQVWQRFQSLAETRWHHERDRWLASGRLNCVLVQRMMAEAPAMNGANAGLQRHCETACPGPARRAISGISPVSNVLTDGVAPFLIRFVLKSISEMRSDS
jgi:hypothetical protein